MARHPSREVPDDRLASLDEHGHRVALNPAAVDGRFRRWRDHVYNVLIVVFLVLPWTTFRGHQTILLDIPNRRFAFFGVTFWAHDVPLVFFVLGLATFGLSFVTAIWGRVWCGWACPQTVFIDRVYRRIEAWVEGNHIQRAHLARAPWTAEKIRKRAIKWFLFWFVSTNIAHSFTAYFIGAHRLLAMSLHAPGEHMTAFLFVTSLTLILMFDFGWFREQFCIIMCPYGRFQSVLMDRHSLAILYDVHRGEPRKGIAPEGVEHGDCINCYKCVAVCPTGIDIRRGVQLECIACTACIDACDGIMDHIGRPRGLIRYASEAQMAGEQRRPMRPRTVLLGIVLLTLATGFGVTVANRPAVDAEFIRAVGEPYATTETRDGTEVINHFKVYLNNQSFDEQEVSLELVRSSVCGGDASAVTMVAPMFPLHMRPGARESEHVFLRCAPAVTASGRCDLEVLVRTRSARGEQVRRYRVPVLGPAAGP